MPRKTRTAPTQWTPNPDCAAAFDRAVATAKTCAAAVSGTAPSGEGESLPRPVLLQAMGMIYFLCRLDPKDLAALCTGPGSFADLRYRPFPPGFRQQVGLEEQLSG